MMAKGIIPMDDKYSLWTIGIPQKDYVNQLFDRADLVIAIGYDIVECAPAKWGARPDMTILHIDNAPADVNKRYQPAVEVVGDISESIYEILRCAHRDSEPEFALRLRETMVAEHAAMADDDSCPMKPARILADVRKVMGREDILVSDVGAHKMWIARHYDCYAPNTCLISNGFASMGFSIPGAFAAKLLNPDKKVLAVCGDGGFMMNSQELETAVREKVPFVTLIWEDSSYGPHQMEGAGAVRRRALLRRLHEPRLQAAGRGHALQGLPGGKGFRPHPHPRGSLPADGAQRHCGAGGLQRKHEAFCASERGVSAERRLSMHLEISMSRPNVISTFRLCRCANANFPMAGRTGSSCS